MCYCSLSQPGYVNEGWGKVRGESRVRETSREGGSEGDKGESHTIKLCSVELQRPTCYSHAMLNYKFLSSLPLSVPTLFIGQFMQKSRLDTHNGIWHIDMFNFQTF